MILTALALTIATMLSCSALMSSAVLACSAHNVVSNSYFMASLLMCILFLAAHSLDHATMDSYVNSHSSVSFQLMITTVHASHVLMCLMIVFILPCNASATLGIISLAYCHLVEILWIAIMSVTMLVSNSVA